MTRLEYAKQFKPSLRLGYALFVQEAKRRHESGKFDLVNEIKRQREAKINPMVALHESYSEFLTLGFKTEAWRKLCASQRHVHTFVSHDQLDESHYWLLIATIAHIGSEGI